jgi:REP element-mobilizing transposase RayT
MKLDWGGCRAGAGRKRIAARRRVEHRTREGFPFISPLFVTIRVAHNVYNLRSQRSFNVLKRIFAKAADRFDTRIIHFAVLGNHIHLIIESSDRVMLWRAMKGLGVRIAKRMNRMMNRRGQVIDDRYDARIIQSRRGACRVIRYVRENHRKHFGKPDEWRTGVTIDEFSSWAKAVVLPEPTTSQLVCADPFS